MRFFREFKRRKVFQVAVVYAATAFAVLQDPTKTEALRALPRFAELLELHNLPQYWDETGWPDYCSGTDTGDIQCH